MMCVVDQTADEEVRWERKLAFIRGSRHSSLPVRLGRTLALMIKGRLAIILRLKLRGRVYGESFGHSRLVRGAPREFSHC
jgi:hypothetical protein